MLIIDEISMVGSDFLLEIHRRLSEIMGNDSPFGGVSVLAVGDLYQLPPVGHPFIFSPPQDLFAHIHMPLWQEHFRIVELTDIMRQRNDIQFAQLLNRVRTVSQTKEDIKVLCQRMISPDNPDFPQDALHVYATNNNVDKHTSSSI